MKEGAGECYSQRAGHFRSFIADWFSPPERFPSTYLQPTWPKWWTTAGYIPTLQLRVYSGHREDKSGLFQVDYGVLQTAPLIRECPVNLECKILHVLDLGSHRLIVGEIVESHVRSDCMVDGQPDAAKIDPIVYLTGNQQYCHLGEMVGRAFSIGKKD